MRIKSPSATSAQALNVQQNRAVDLLKDMIQRKFKHDVQDLRRKRERHASKLCKRLTRSAVFRRSCWRKTRTLKITRSPSICPVPPRETDESKIYLNVPGPLTSHYNKLARNSWELIWAMVQTPCKGILSCIMWDLHEEATRLYFGSFAHSSFEFTGSVPVGSSRPVV